MLPSRRLSALGHCRRVPEWKPKVVNLWYVEFYIYMVMHCVIDSLWQVTQNSIP